MNDQIKDEYAHLQDSDAIKKIQHLVSHNEICLFSTHLSEQPIQTRPMSVRQVDEKGNLWFLSSKESNKNWEIQSDPKVQLFFVNTKDYEFLSIYGHAQIFIDREKVDELWTPIVKTWFQEGKDDPLLSIIRVSPEDVYYWDTKNNKAVSLLKIAASVIVGKTMDDGIEGRLEISENRNMM